jgi:hypothetical protein
MLSYGFEKKVKTNILRGSRLKSLKKSLSVLGLPQNPITGGRAFPTVMTLTTKKIRPIDYLALVSR